MRVLAECEVQFELMCERDEVGPGPDGSAAREGWWSVTVRAIWRSPSGRMHAGESKLDRIPLAGDYTADVVARDGELREAALSNLNEALREFHDEAEAIRRYLERDVFEVRAGTSTEGFFPDRAGAERYAEQLRKELGAQSVEVVPTSPKGKIRSVRDPKPEKLRP